MFTGLLLITAICTRSLVGICVAGISCRATVGVMMPTGRLILNSGVACSTTYIDNLMATVRSNDCIATGTAAIC